MKCSKCFFCCNIGKGVMYDFPVKYCRHTKQYKFPFIWIEENGTLTQRQLDFSKESDCKIWREVGCDIHPAKVKKAKNEYIEKMKGITNEWTEKG